MTPESEAEYAAFDQIDADDVPHGGLHLTTDEIEVLMELGYVIGADLIEGADNLREAAQDAKRPAKVLFGDPGAMLIVRHVDYRPEPSQGER